MRIRSGCCRRGPNSRRSTIYELWYEATEPKIVGIGYAATRDLVSFLRYARSRRQRHRRSGCRRGAPDHACVAFGISQSGRYLRHHIELGMNERREAASACSTACSAHIAGAGKVFANHTFGEPGRTATQHEDHAYPENWFPFSTAMTIDPFSRQDAARCCAATASIRC